MTNPLPESAVELAVRLATTATATPRDTCLDHEEYAEAIIRAALPAIREAVVAEFKGLADKWRADLDGWAGVRSEYDPDLAYVQGRASCADELAALTEQENRNDQERSHDGG